MLFFPSLWQIVLLECNQVHLLLKCDVVPNFIRLSIKGTDLKEIIFIENIHCTM